MSKEDVNEVIDRSFRGRWFRAADLVACLEYSSRCTTRFSDVLNLLNKMVGEGRLEIDQTRSWFRVRKETLSQKINR